MLENLDLLDDPSFGPDIAQLDGVPVHELLADADPLLGGAGSPFTPLDMFVILNDVDMAFAKE